MKNKITSISIFLIIILLLYFVPFIFFNNKANKTSYSLLSPLSKNFLINDFLYKGFVDSSLYNLNIIQNEPDSIKVEWLLNFYSDLFNKNHHSLLAYHQVYTQRGKTAFILLSAGIDGKLNTTFPDTLTTDDLENFSFYNSPIKEKYGIYSFNRTFYSIKDKFFGTRDFCVLFIDCYEYLCSIPKNAIPSLKSLINDLERNYKRLDQDTLSFNTTYFAQAINFKVSIKNIDYSFDNNSFIFNYNNYNIKCNLFDYSSFQREDYDTLIISGWMEKYDFRNKEITIRNTIISAPLARI